MALTKLSCPHCGAVMKPARPIPEGKTVKCPKCDRPFKVGAEPPAGPPESAITSKGAARSPSGTSPKATAAKASDDEGGIYAVIKDEEVDAPKKKKPRKDDEDEEEDDEDEEEEEEDATSIYLKSLKVADPRGKAQEAVVTPANWLLRAALLGFLGWVATFIYFMLPIAFPNRQESEESKSAYDKWKAEADAKEKKEKESDPKAAATGAKWSFFGEMLSGKKARMPSWLWFS